MDKRLNKRALLAASVLCAMALALPASAQSRGGAVAQTSPPDYTLYTTYSFDAAYRYASLVVCGSTLSSDGCYGSAVLGPFGRVGAVIEGSGTVSGNYVTRYIYIVDEAVGGGAAVRLYVYKKTDTVTTGSDTVTVKLVRTMALPLSGGVHATTFMAANGGFLFVGTNEGPFALKIRKSDLAVTSIGGFSPPINVSSITSDSYGHVAITFGNGLGPNGFYVFGREGNFDEDGGGADVLVGTAQGLSTTGLLTSNGIPAARMQIRLKAKPVGK